MQKTPINNFVAEQTKLRSVFEKKQQDFACKDESKKYESGNKRVRPIAKLKPPHTNSFSSISSRLVIHVYQASCTNFVKNRRID